MYKETNIAKIHIDDESSPSPLPIDVRTSTTEQVIIQIGNTCTLRINQTDADRLIHVLDEAVKNLDKIRYENNIIQRVQNSK